MTKLKVTGLCKSYDQQALLRDINFEVAEGSLFSILGASGSGKTTILKIISGLIPADHGQVYLDGCEISRLKPEERGIAYVFQEPLLFPHLTVKDNIGFGLMVRNVKPATIESRVDQLLTLLKIEDLKDRRPFEISGGQQQRVAIARALATEPPLILMDEPFSNLDLLLRQEMGALLKRLQQQLGLTIVFVTHDLNESLILSDQIALMADGKILQSGSAKRVYYQPGSPQIGALMGAGNWIPGQIEQGCFRSALGSFNAPGQAPGPAHLFLRPHQLDIAPPSADNRFKIVKIAAQGKETRLFLAYQNGQLLVDTFKDLTAQAGDWLGLEFPSHRLHYVRLAV